MPTPERRGPPSSRDAPPQAGPCRPPGSSPRPRGAWTRAHPARPGPSAPTACRPMRTVGPSARRQRAARSPNRSKGLQMRHGGPHCDPPDLRPPTTRSDAGVSKPDGFVTPGETVAILARGRVFAPGGTTMTTAVHSFNIDEERTALPARSVRSGTKDGLTVSGVRSSAPRGPEARQATREL